MASSRYESHYSFLWPPVFMTLTTVCFYGLQLLRHSLRLVFMAFSGYDTHFGLFLWPSVVTTLTSACFYGLQSLRNSLRLVLMASSRYDTHFGLF